MPRSSAKIPYLTTLTILILAGLVCFGTAATLGWVAAPSRPQGPPQRGPAQRVRFTLYNSGIFPQEAQARQGRVIIAVEDRAGGDRSLAIERETAGGPEEIGRVRRAAAGPRGREEFRLTPGRYSVYDAARPESRALLIVEH